MEKHSTTRLRHGIRNGKLLSIRDVASGLACYATCPSCDARLVAKKGDRMTHHFAHHKGNECAGAQMTALHKRAESLIQEGGYMRYPAVPGTNTSILKESEIRIFDSVVVEDTSFLSKWAIKPDVVAKSEDGICLIEIALTHPVDENKLVKLQSLGFPALEISLSVDEHGGLTDDQLREIVLDRTFTKMWLFHPLQQRELDQISQEEAKREAERRISQKLFFQKAKSFAASVMVALAIGMTVVYVVDEW